MTQPRRHTNPKRKRGNTPTLADASGSCPQCRPPPAARARHSIGSAFMWRLTRDGREVHGTAPAGRWRTVPVRRQLAVDAAAQPAGLRDRYGGLRKTAAAMSIRMLSPPALRRQKRPGRASLSRIVSIAVAAPRPLDQFSTRCVAARSGCNLSAKVAAQAESKGQHVPVCTTGISGHSAVRQELSTMSVFARRLVDCHRLIFG